MIDPNRLNRIHVIGVALVKDIWYVRLSNGEKISWKEWCGYTQEERWNWK